MFWENSVYYKLDNLIKGSNMTLGVYARNKVDIDNGRPKLGDIKHL